MNKRSVKKKRPARASRSTEVRKGASRKVAARKTSVRSKTTASKARTRQAARPRERTPELQPEAIITTAIAAISTTTLTVAQVVARTQVLRTHKYHVGQTVSYTSSPISRPGASGGYMVVKLLPSDGDDYQYRIKNPGEAFERVAKESQLELEFEH
jgi:hypothetical protein